MVGGLLVGQAALLCWLEELLYAGEPLLSWLPWAVLGQLPAVAGSCLVSGTHARWSWKLLHLQGTSNDARSHRDTERCSAACSLFSRWPRAGHAWRALHVPALAGGGHQR